MSRRKEEKKKIVAGAGQWHRSGENFGAGPNWEGRKKKDQDRPAKCPKNPPEEKEK